MKRNIVQAPAQLVAQVANEEWVSFPGGELEAPRPKAMCAACREALKREALAQPIRPTRPTRPISPAGPLCFQCYRAELDRERALKAAGRLDTASVERFQSQLPFEAVHAARLAMLKADRAEARVASSRGIGQYVDKRRHAQIAARHALQLGTGVGADQHRLLSPAAIHAAELQLPDAWLPFVVSR